MREQMKYTRQDGFSILEVLIGIFIFVVGLLALSALQGALTRSMADAKVRTTAVNIAEFTIESNRNFSRLLTDDVNNVFAYNDIVGGDPTTVPVNGMNYSVAVDVTDYYYELATDSYTTTSTLASASDYKQVEVTVSWDATQNFRGDEGTELTAADLGTGSVKLTSVIPAIVSSASARIADANENDDVGPTISYTPGLNPDVIALDLGGGKFKESLLPEPDVIRTNELVQTTFDVITYSSNNTGSEFLRREEFAAVSCECTLRAASSANLARRPAIWAGDEYAGGHWVEKPYGESANNQQSLLCNSCCRDHHDGGTTGQTGDSGDAFANVFGPFKADNEYASTARQSDHLHYEDDAATIAGNGDGYLEACRLVRVDGFWRVAQDFRREDQYIFPDDFLDNVNETEEFETYSGYVTSAAALYTAATSDGYPTSSPPCIGSAGCETAPTMQSSYLNPRAIGELPSWTSLKTSSKEVQQLRSRAIYIDYMSADLRLFLSACFEDAVTLKNDCCIRNGAEANACTADDLYIDKVVSASQLEVIPFFEVQLTKLENWDQNVQATLPIDLTNEALEDANAHSRGEITQLNLGITDVTAMSHRGNIGFTNTLPIDPVFEATDALLNVHSLDASGAGGGGGGTDPTVVAGTFTESVLGSPKIAVESSSDDIVCTLTNKGYTCSVADGATSGTVRVFGYEDTLKGVLRYACSDTLVRTQSSATPGNTHATFDLFSGGVVVSAGAAYDIRITTTDC